jgi:hypothetical protein
MNRYRLLLAIGLLSAALIAFQLALIQILSLVQWYHFAYMVISVALLGFGAAGTALALFRETMIRHTGVLLPGLLAATGLAMAGVTGMAQTAFFRFDSYLLFTSWNEAAKLLWTYLLFFIPFYLGALALGLVFVGEVKQIGRIYFANLTGSGAGGLLALLLVWRFTPSQLPAILALLPVVASGLVIPEKKKAMPLALIALATGLIGWQAGHPPTLVLSQYKDLPKTLLLPQARIRSEQPSPYGLVQTVTSPVLRYAPGLSLTAPTTAPIKMAAFINGDWVGALLDPPPPGSAFILDHTTGALPYLMAPRKKVLVLRAGTGIEVIQALHQGGRQVTAVEPNALLLATWQEAVAGRAVAGQAAARLQVRHLEPRTFLMMDTSRYDLISLPMVGTFGGSSGLFALQEQFLLTREALTEMWRRLSPGGAISITSWMDYPVRNPLKILATLLAVGDDLGLEDPGRHLAAIRSWGTITFVLTRAPVSAAETARIRRFCDQMWFDPALLPGLQASERARYNQFQDNRFLDYVDQLLSPQRAAFIQSYDFNIRPATDNRPYFSQFIRWTRLSRIAGFFGGQALPFFELGYLLIAATLVQLIVFSFILILLPLFKIGWRGHRRQGILLYFGGIGLGYMFVEIIFIQRFILYFGNPVYAAAAVITALLLFSGAGSYWSPYFTAKARLQGVLGLIVGLLLAYAFVFTGILQLTIHWPLALKVLLVLGLLAPLAFCMGIPFPAGLSQLAEAPAGEVAWAWGINGCISVISTVGATLVAVEMGSQWVLVCAACAYGLPFLVQGQHR